MNKSKKLLHGGASKSKRNGKASEYYKRRELLKSGKGKCCSAREHWVAIIKEYKTEISDLEKENKKLLEIIAKYGL